MRDRVLPTEKLPFQNTTVAISHAKVPQVGVRAENKMCLIVKALVMFFSVSIQCYDIDSFILSLGSRVA